MARAVRAAVSRSRAQRISRIVASEGAVVEEIVHVGAENVLDDSEQGGRLGTRVRA